jgi:hypothetical protein
MWFNMPYSFIEPIKEEKTCQTDLNIILEKLEKLKQAKSCFGICSNTGDNKHVIFLDFDKKKYAEVYSCCHSMQFLYDLSTFYILETENGYNAFCLSKKTLNELKNMYKHFNSIDNLFVELSLKKRGFFVLRMTKDKRLISHIENHNAEPLSYAHYLFFKTIMDYPLFSIDTFDNLLTTKIICYKSVKHGYAEVKI